MTDQSRDLPARVWTREELNDTHPLPDGWEWRLSDIFAKPYAAFGEEYTVEVIAGGVRQLKRLSFGWEPCEQVHEDVALAVILASKGLDSREAMTDALDTMADTAIDRIQPLADAGRTERAYQADGDAAGLRTAAAMLRLGTVKSR